MTNPCLKTLWTDALYSGEYVQLRYNLHFSDHSGKEPRHFYSVLGVLANEFDKHIQAGGKPTSWQLKQIDKSNDKAHYYAWQGNMSTLPEGLVSRTFR